MRHWTVSEISYLEEHAHEGPEAVSQALGRSVNAVKAQASRYGISLRRRWLCPRCGSWVHKPLVERTGWCAACSKARQRERLEADVAALKEEMEREQDENRRRQALYSQKNRLRNIDTKMKLPRKKGKKDGN